MNDRVAAFYARPGDLFGATAGRPHPHRAVDFPHPLGTPIPSWIEGTVVASYWDDALGNVVVLEVELDGRTAYAGHSHLLQRADLEYGSHIRYGDIVGAVGNTGSASRGAHDHASASYDSSRPDSGPVIDPLPHIRAQIALHATREEEHENMSSILYQSNVKDARVVYERDTVTNTTRILGKTDGALGYLGAAPILTGRKVYEINEAQLRELLSFYPCEPVPKALFDRLKGNSPAIIGLKSA